MPTPRRLLVLSQKSCAFLSMIAPPVVTNGIEPEVNPVMARLVVVACEVVALTAVKFWRVVEPVARIFPNVPAAVVVILLAVEIVPKPDAIEPEVRAPMDDRFIKVVRDGRVVVEVILLENGVIKLVKFLASK